MKTTLVAFGGLPRWGAGAALLALCSFLPASRADVIIDNTGDPLNAYVLKSGNPIAQVFTMSGTSGNVSSLTVSLHVYTAGSVAIDLYNTYLGAPTGSGTLLGIVSAGTTGDQSFVLSLQNNPPLSAGGTYAVVLAAPTSGSFGFQATSTSSSGGSGTLGGIYYNNAGTWTSTSSGSYWQMNLQAVPEVPMTGLAMGFGALAIAVGGTLRRTLRPTDSSNG